MNKFKFFGSLILVFIVGIWIGDLGDNSPHPSDGQSEMTVWTCSMHPNIKLPEKGQCPICFMDLIPLKSGHSDGESVELKLSPEAEKLAEIQTTAVKREKAFAEINVIGKLDYDESRIRTISSWISGRIERLYVDYTGIPVREKDHLLEIYSPQLIAAQEEYLTILNSSSEKGIRAAGEKLRLLGITSAQINRLKRDKIVRETLTVYSPISGIVIAKNAREGEYIKTGRDLFRVVDLSRLWLMLDIFESDLNYLYLGQQVEFSLKGSYGEPFSGEVAFISPTLNPESRSVKVRVNIDNLDLKLKPDMFVKAVVKSRLDAQGKPIQSQLAGKWICPMHPEDVHDSPGDCTICGMNVVRSEDIKGLVGLGTNPGDEDPLLIPTTAVLRTGSRSVVYTRTSDDDGSSIRMKEIILGPKTGKNYIVLAGLDEGEEVVSHGAFKIDSEMQISAHPSMMNDINSGSNGKDLEIPYQALSQDEIKTVLPHYIGMQENLAGDNYKAAAGNYNDLLHAGVNLKLDFGEVSGISDLRENFNLLSYLVIANSGQIETKDDLNVAFCPMAFDNSGASWLQTGKVINNPYFGASMLRCGTIKRGIGTDNGK